jgi:hypothetical protein
MTYFTAAVGFYVAGSMVLILATMDLLVVYFKHPPLVRLWMQVGAAILVCLWAIF